MGDKKSFIMYNSYKRHFEKMTPEEAKIFLLAIFDYSENLIEPDLPKELALAFSFIQDNMDRDNEKWMEEKKKRSEAGKKGMASRWHSGDITNDNRP